MKAAFDLIRAIFGFPVVLIGLLVILIGCAIGGDFVSEAVYKTLKDRSIV